MTTTETKQGWTQEQEAAIARLMEHGGVARRAAIRQMLKAERGEVAPAPAPKAARKPKAAKVTKADKQVEVAAPSFSLRAAAAEADRLLKEGSLSQGLALILTPLTRWAQKSLGYRDDQLKKAKKARK